MTKTIVIIAALDTKGEPAAYFKRCIEAKGVNTILIDINMGGEASITPDISAAEVAEAGGGDIQAVRASKNTGEITPIMIRGAIAKVKELYDEGRLDGIAAFGGASGTTVATSIMKSLPFGIPKFMASSAASMPAYAARYIDTKDITMMHSVVDIDGLNHLSISVLDRAAGGVCGMVDASTGAVRPKGKRPLITMTEFKFNGECAHYIQDMLLEKGYNVIPFHAQGIGDRVMDELIDQNMFDGVIDLVPAGISEYLFGGNRAANTYRLEAAGRQGIPQVVTPCGFDMLSCGPLERKEQNDQLWTSRKLAQRKKYVPDTYRVQVRTSVEELHEIVNALSHKLNKAQGPVTFLIPIRGWSVLSVKGAPLHEPETSAIFVPLLRQKLKSEIIIEEIDTHINTTTFASAVVKALDKMMCR
jgi:uncharacterized protein (UPF0261 family)